MDAAKPDVEEGKEATPRQPPRPAPSNTETPPPGKRFTAIARKTNEAGYTAISCGLVGRGRNARFTTF